MKVIMFSSRSYDIQYFEPLISEPISINFFDAQLNQQTAILARGYDAVCAFVNDDLSAPVLHQLKDMGIKCIAMRCAGFNNIDLDCAKALGITIVRVPAYSPEAVAEHAIALLMTLNRRIHKAYQRTRDANFSLQGLVGFNLHGKTVGIIGTGKIGVATMAIFKGFGCKILASDPYPSEHAIALGAEYVDLDRLFTNSDVISLHCPLTAENKHLLNEKTFALMKDGVTIINTSRGGLLDANDAIEALKSGRIGGLGLDVYEEEEHLFFNDHSSEIITDDTFRRLSACHNVIFTGHQAFLTKEALISIAQTTLSNLTEISAGNTCANQVLTN
ncbi:2-hydroxyacid dehydrogenase [Moritella sp. F3]|uniref:2-hydroxyacid dehydrogenase n=1 Tax=Moritella sp. F3 TaxID=2718882 RepID=UPI0018E162B2|nr:2-hydroxyacid dehydrogenase [Moritella sp. F3]GIC78989.1 lactate dehydrogenase [Moritella sp. F1]GIC83421.1 lactate dehydrogenase [Moritella sp. F3]